MGQGKLSWKEIDRLRDKRGQHQRSKSSLERALERNPRLKKKYLEEADKLFSGLKGNSSNANPKALQKIHDKYGTKEFENTAIKYVDKYGMPEDWHTLILFLDIKEATGLLRKAIDILVRLARERSSLEVRGLISKLKVLSMVSSDPLLLEDVDEALSSLNQG